MLLPMTKILYSDITAWEFKFATVERSASKAIGDAKFIRKALLIVVDTIEPHVVLTCDNNGNFS